jgi:hypothetical protein
MSLLLALLSQPEQTTFRGWGPTSGHWVLVQPTDDTKAKIAAVSRILETFVAQLKGTNSSPDQQALTELERAMLVTVLETALQVLKAPMVEKSLLTKSQEALKHVATRTAEKQAEQGLGKLAGEGARMLLDLLKSLFGG